MARFASLTLSIFVLAGAARALPQEEDPRLKPTLKASDLKSLNLVAQKWIQSELKWDEDPKHRTRRDRALQKFKLELKRKSKSVDVLANVGNMLAIFEGAFPYKRQSTSGEIKRAKGSTYHILEPKPYKHTEPYPSVLVLPGWDAAKKKWTESKAYVEAGWKKSTLAKSIFTVVPDLQRGGEYDKPADLGSDKGRQDELDRIKGILQVFGDVQRKYHLDRERMFLDCGDGTAGFGMRLVTYFPSRFAGVIVRNPVELGDMQLESLAGLPILMISTEKTKPIIDKIKKALDKLVQGQSSQVTAVVAGPAVGSTIDGWMAKTKRRLFPLEVTIAPNHDRFNKAFWVDIISCEPLELVKRDERPLLKVKADPEKNQIIVTARSVSEIGLYLNDYILDLDKEVSIVVNGKEIKGNKFQRTGIRKIYEYMNNAYDPTALYTAYHRFEIPKAEKKADDGGK